MVTGAQSRTAALRQCIQEFAEKGIPGFANSAGDKEGFQKASAVLKQRESVLKNYCASIGRAYKSDRVQVSGFGRSTSSKATAENKAFTTAKERDKIIVEITNASSLRGVVDIPPRKIKGVKLYAFDDAHINGERAHSLTKDDALRYINTASFTQTAWEGRFVNYYGHEGCVYVDVDNQTIRTAYSKDEFKDKKVRLTSIDGQVFEGETDWYPPPQDNADNVATICVGDYEFKETEIQSLEVVES